MGAGGRGVVWTAMVAAAGVMLTSEALPAAETDARHTAGTSETSGSSGPAVPTFDKDVAPILYHSCVRCHRSGGMAPMSLMTYKDARPWARSMRKKVVSREMPPWHADPHYGHFSNDFSLNQQQIDTIAAWVSGGAPEGNPADLPPVPPTPPDGWRIGKPDMVVEMPVEFSIPASGTIDYQYFIVDPHLKQDRWISAGEVVPGDRAHVHHLTVSVIEPGTHQEGVERASGALNAKYYTIEEIFPEGKPAPAPPKPPNPNKPIAPKYDYILVNYAVGEEPPVYRSGEAKLVKAGSKFVFNAHYTTNGTPGKDRSRMGLIFAKGPIEKEVHSGYINNSSFAIPAYAPNHKVEAEVTFLEDVHLETLHPHMHFRGKSKQYVLTHPDGRSEILLNVPKYDFGWQLDYWLAEPILAEKGSKLRAIAYFDNSAQNAFNPNPAEEVRYGEQTWEEMMTAWFTFTVDEENRHAGTASR